MKTKLAFLFLLLVMGLQRRVQAATIPADVDAKVIRAFQEAFPMAEKVTWDDNGEDYFVHFRDHEILSEIEYDYDGNFVSSERYYTNEGLLPINLALALHKKFPDKTIFGITETNNNEETLYYIKMENKKEWMTVVGTTQGTTAVTEKFYKQN